MAQKSESFFKEYLKKIPDKDIRQYYNDVEWTPFPVLVIKEYQNRFKPKDKKVQEKLKTETVISKKKSQIIREIVKQKRSDAKHFKNETKKKIAKKVKAAKKMTSSSEHNLRLLEKLADLKDKGIITSSEFQEKKKKILEKI